MSNPESPSEWDEGYLTLANAAGDGILIIQDGVVRYANPSTAKLFGIPPEEVVGKSFLEFVAPGDIESADEVYRAVLAGERESVSAEIQVPGKDGLVRDIEVSANTIQFRGRPALLGIGRDVTETKQALVAVEEGHQRFRRFTESISDAIWVLDMNMRFTYCSPAVERIRGFTAQEVMQQSLEQSLTPESFAHAMQVLAEELEKEEDAANMDPDRSATLELEQICKDGSTVPVEVKVTGLRDENLKLIGLLGVTRDVRGRKRAQDELRQAKEAAEAASRAKSEFLANMGHELRTPLSGAIGMAELLLGTRLDPRQREYAQNMLRSGQTLLSIIDELLDFSQIEAGRASVSSAPFDLRAAIEDAAQMLFARAHEKKLSLDVEYDGKLPRRLIGDAGRIRQVLTNLVENATKFTESGRVSVRAECLHKTDHEVRVRVTVSDTGIGILPGDLERIFEKFTQVDSSRSRQHGGTGLGLAIVKQLVALMGGTIGVDSRPGKGSAFWFELNLRLLESESQPVEDQAAGGLRVLVVEDDLVNQEVEAAILKKLGCRVDLAGGGPEAVRLVARTCYDLIFMDCSMPGMDGFQTTAEIRKQEEGSGRYTRIVAMTAHALEEDRQRCLQAGMDDYISKPATLKDFQNLLERLIG